MSVEKLVFYFWKETNYIALPPGKRSPSWRRERERNIWGIASSHRWHWWIISLSLLQHAAEQNRTEMAHSAHLSIPDSLGSNGRIGRRRGWEGQRENQWVRGEKKSCCKSRWLDNELNDYQSLAWKVAQKSQFISQPAPRPHQPIKSPAGRLEIWFGAGAAGGGGGCRSVRVSQFFFPSASLTDIFLSGFLLQRIAVSATAALVSLCGRQRILKATITAQNYQFPLQLTLWEERGTRKRKGSKRRKGLRNNVKFVMKKIQPRSLFTLPPEYCHVFQLRGERITVPLGWTWPHHQRSNKLQYSAGPPFLITCK